MKNNSQMMEITRNSKDFHVEITMMISISGRVEMTRNDHGYFQWKRRGK